MTFNVYKTLGQNPRLVNLRKRDEKGRNEGRKKEWKEGRKKRERRGREGQTEGKKGKGRKKTKA